MNHKIKFAVVIVLLLVVIVLAGCTFGGGGGDNPPPTTGAIVVFLGFGAGSSQGSQCTGNGTVTVSGPTSASQPYSFTGISESSAPACRTSVTFGNLQPGSYSVSGICPTKQVTAGNITEFTIRTDTVTCQ